MGGAGRGTGWQSGVILQVLSERGHPAGALPGYKGVCACACACIHLEWIEGQGKGPPPTPKLQNLWDLCLANLL